jgi:hypothetical protein
MTEARLLDIIGKAIWEEGGEISQAEAKEAARHVLTALLAADAAALAGAGLVRIEDAVKACEQVTFSMPIDEWIGMTLKEMSERSCHECATAIRALAPAAEGEGHE